MITSQQQEKYYTVREISHLSNDMILACDRGDLELVHYLLTSTHLINHANIHHKNDMALILAAENGHLNLVSYLLFSPSLSMHANIHAQDNEALIAAYKNKHWEVVDYLLSSSDLHTLANFHAQDDFIFRDCLHKQDFQRIKHFIFQADIVQNFTIMELSLPYPNIDSIFQQKTLNKQLMEQTKNKPKKLFGLFK